MPDSGRSKPAVRVALLADTHGTLDRRIQTLVAGCDLAIHGGDIGHAAILGQLQPRGGRVLAVRGNNDRQHDWPESDWHPLSLLPDGLEQVLPGGRLAVIHGHQIPARQRHARLRRRFPQARVIVYGHSHRLALDLDESPWVLNPGAAGRYRNHGGPSCLILTAGPLEWRIEVHHFTLGSADPVSAYPD